MRTIALATMAVGEHAWHLNHSCTVYCCCNMLIDLHLCMTVNNCGSQGPPPSSSLSQDILKAWGQ